MMMNQTKPHQSGTAYPQAWRLDALSSQQHSNYISIDIEAYLVRQIARDLYRILPGPLGGKTKQ